MESKLRVPLRSISLAFVALTLVAGVSVGTAFAATGLPEGLPDTAGLTDGLEQLAGEGVEKIDLGSSGATLTMAGGKTVVLDAAELTGAKKGAMGNYFAYATWFFGASMLLRLMTMVKRLVKA